jgi:hypothetical protein
VGSSHACVLSDDGSAYCWGRNESGQLGIGAAGEGSDTPIAVAGGIRFTEVSAGAAHSCGLATDGVAYCWGLDTDGQLGAPATAACGGFACSPRPTAVAGDRRFEQVSAGFQHTCGLSARRAFCWGRNVRGELGVRRTTRACLGMACSVVPVAVESDVRFSAISARGEHSCALTKEGTAYCWGDNRAGQLGVGSGAELVVHPTRVPAPTRFAELAAGGLHTCALDVNGRAYCWGSNETGALGVVSQDARSVPSPVATDQRFAAITTTGAHSCALTRDGTAVCWGRDPYVRSVGAPGLAAPVAGLRGLTSLSAGGTETCAVTTDGTRCWGAMRDALVAKR